MPSREYSESTIDSEGFKGGTRGSPIMPRDAVSRTANVERNGGQKWIAYDIQRIKHSLMHSWVQLKMSVHRN